MRAKILLPLAAIAVSLAGAYLLSDTSSIAPTSSVTVAGTSSERARSLVAAAREQIGVVTEYSTAYYARESIPPQAGACADVVWRALERVGYDLPVAIALDLREHPDRYPSEPAHDPNVDFRRVRMVRAYLEAHAELLTTDIRPRDAVSLATWQAGDIVTFAASAATGGLEHIAIVSDRRDADGVPLLIHNYWQGTREMPHLLAWPSDITGHYRFFR